MCGAECGRCNRARLVKVIPMAAIGPVSSDLSALMAFPLVGRDAELTQLRTWLDRVGNSPEPAVFLRGEGGVGKSRLARAVGEDARRKDWTVLAGRAYPVESSAPYALLSDAFVPFLRTLEPSALVTLTRGGDDALRTLFPALGASTGAAADEGSPEELKTRLYWNFTELLRGLAERSPILILLEDIEWADRPSLELLHFLVRQTAGAPVRVVATYDDTHLDEGSELPEVERSLHTQELLRLLPLGCLERRETAQMIQEAFSVDPGLIDGFVERLHRWTGGNPFFVEETLKALVEEGRLTRQEGAWVGWDTRDLALPESIRDAVLQRTNRLPRAAEDVANVAAVLGTRTSFRHLRAAASQSEGDLLSGLDELRSRKLMRERLDGAEVWYEFAHPLVRETLYAELGLARTRVLHGRVAAALEALYGEQADEHADELAFHYDRAGTEAPEGRVERFLISAGRRAFRRSAYHTAVDQLGSALRRMRDSDRSWLASDAGLEVLEELAVAHQAIGRTPEALGLLEEARDLASPDDAERRTRLERRTALVHLFTGQYSAALDAVASGEALAADAGARAERGRLLLIRGLCLEQLGQADAARATLQDALRLAEELGEETLLAKVNRGLALAFLWVGRPDRVRAHATRAVDLAGEQGGTVLFWSYWVLAVLEGLTGNVDRMPALIDRAEAVADRLRSPQLRLWAAELRIELASATCDWDRGLAVGEQAIDLARRLGQGALLPRLLVWTSLIYVGRGDAERAHQLLDEAWERAGADDRGETVDVHTVVPAHTGKAVAHLFEGDYGRAVEYARAGLEIADRTGYVIWAVHRLLPTLAESILGQRDLEAAAAVGTRMRRDSERLGHKLGLAWSDACDAIVCWLSGDLEGGIVGLRAAAESLDAVPFTWDAARVRRQLAGRLAEAGRSEEALAELRTVHETFARIGARRELSRTREMFRELGARPPAREQSTGAGASALTGREIEIARLVAERKSNKAIAKALSISPRTVSTHLSNIYKKLGVNSRGELTDLVRTTVLLGE